ncbi:MAG: Mth938-like domain-containing protein [Betaproteobacteria bacterium]|nr:Mth938-like domain-containing protein [Betaproteobacteria bacterium]
MKLHRSTFSGNLIRAYGADHVLVNERRFTTSLVLAPDEVLEHWGRGGFEGLAETDFAAILVFEPELVVFGTGQHQRFPSPALLRPLIEARIGCEVMDTGAACRTYNILAAEGRRVAAALLLEG